MSHCRWRALDSSYGQEGIPSGLPNFIVSPAVANGVAVAICQVLRTGLFQSSGVATIVLRGCLMSGVLQREGWDGHPVPLGTGFELRKPRG